MFRGGGNVKSECRAPSLSDWLDQTRELSTRNSELTGVSATLRRMTQKGHTHRDISKGKRARITRPAQAPPVRRKSLRKKGRAPAQRWLSARTSDRYDLYEKSVQEPEAESDLVDQVWKELRRRTPHHIREDFCGTAAVCRDWVQRRRNNTAVGVDLDQKVLNWGMARAQQQLSRSQLARMTLINGDVRTIRLPRSRKVDSVLAMNFSYYIFKTRDALRSYFKAARTSLVKDGMFLLDCYGGSDSFREISEDRNIKWGGGFTYVWDQNKYNPITGEVLNYIHFEFPDGTKIKKAFTYDWRLWTIPELRETLYEAGYSNVSVYWEGTTRSGEGDGVWTKTEMGEACEGFVAYLVAER